MELAKILQFSTPTSSESSICGLPFCIMISMLGSLFYQKILKTN